MNVKQEKTASDAPTWYSAEQADAWACGYNAALAGLSQTSQVRQVADRLRKEHFAQTHTDMIGDEDERRGYLMGIEALVSALSISLPHRHSGDK